MALVICCVFLTDRMRRRMSTRAGMGRLAGLLHRLRLEDARERLEGRLAVFRELPLYVLLLRRLLEQLGMARVHEAVQLLFVAARGGHGVLVDVPIGGRED